jgi:hypothetical protein
MPLDEPGMDEANDRGGNGPGLTEWNLSVLELFDKHIFLYSNLVI